MQMPLRRPNRSLRQYLSHFLGLQDPDHFDLQGGWGIVFPADADPVYQDCLQPLINFRNQQTQVVTYTYRAGESCGDFMMRHRITHGSLPGYLLIVGEPEHIPVSLETRLGKWSKVGRIHFPQPVDYRMYARNLVRYEKSLKQEADLVPIENLGDFICFLSRHFKANYRWQVPESLAAFETADLSGLVLMIQRNLELAADVARLLANPGGSASMVILHGESCNRYLGDPACLRFLDAPEAQDRDLGGPAISC